MSFPPRTGRRSTTDELAFGRAVVSRARRTLTIDDHPVKLGARAFDLLAILAEARGDFVSKAELVARTWPNIAVAEVALRVHIAAVRKALAADPTSTIEVEPGLGYRLVAPDPPGPEHALENETGYPIIGRAAFLALIAKELGSNALTTIVGPGGVGKTTVARAAAHAAHRAYPGGLCFVDFVAVTPELVEDTVARALGLAVFSGSPVPGIVAHLQARGVLLVFDTCEHVRHAVADLVEVILQQAPGAQILATSREPLRVRGERVHRLPSLETPPTSTDATLEVARRFSAPALLLDRAARAGAQVADENAPTVIEICERLDGLPMAIEIAAAHLATVGVESVAAQIRAQFALAARGRRTAVARQHTMQATLDWSYGLLSTEEQAALRSLSVFPARFDLQAAERVIGPDVPAARAADLLGDLVARSLVSVLADAPLPYRLLDTTRAYARQALRAAGEASAAGRRHARFCLDALALGADDRPRSALSLDDARAALDWCFGPDGDAAMGVALTDATIELWTSHALFEEHRTIVERAIEPLDDLGLAGGPVELDLQLALGNILYHNGGMALDSATDEAFRRAQRLARTCGSPTDRIRAMSGLIAHGISRGDYSGALQYDADLLGIESPLVAITNRAVAHALLYKGDFETARTTLERATVSDAARPSSSGSGVSYDHITVVETIRARLVWLTDAPREAIRIAAGAVETASAVSPPISLCLTLATGALFVAGMSGVPSLTTHYLHLLEEHATRHSMRRWVEYARAYRLALKPRDRRTAEEAARFDAVVAASNGALLESLAVLGDEHTTPNLIIKALAGEAGWCRAELIRADTRRRLLAGDLDVRGAEARLAEALTMAERQGATPWMLRIGAELMTLRARQGRVAEGRALLEPILASSSHRPGCPNLILAQAAFHQEPPPEAWSAGAEPGSS